MDIYFETYGCSANQNNTEIMKGLAVKHRHRLAESPEKADAIVINTCIVKGPTENKIKRRIHDLQKLDKIIIVAGCMPNLRKEELQGSNIHLLGTKNILDLPKLLDSLSSCISDQKEIKISNEKILQNSVVGITQISEGCLGNCAFCATKLAKGSLYSFPEEDIISSVKHDLERGCKEIWLTSQDLASYGLDSGKPKLPELLRKILALPFDFYLRLGMMNPNNVIKIKEDLIEILKHEKAYKFLHIPAQSGSNKILKLMNRFYTKEEFVELIKEFRKNIPNITISTDIIVGFPQEEDRDFQETVELLNQAKPESINLSKYWLRKGTPASKLKQVPDSISKIRTLSIDKLSKSFLDNTAWKGWQGKVLVNQESKSRLFSRNIFYKRILIKYDKSLFGKFINATITGVKKNFLVGDISV